jgi:PAS domain-containing protein
MRAFDRLFAVRLEVHGIRQWDYNSRMASTGQSTGQASQAQDVDAIPTLAWSARPDGSAEFFNRRWLDYTGLSAEEASDWGWAAALHTEDRDRLLDFWRRLLARFCELPEPHHIRNHD